MACDTFHVIAPTHGLDVPPQASDVVFTGDVDDALTEAFNASLSYGYAVAFCSDHGSAFAFEQGMPQGVVGALDLDAMRATGILPAFGV